MAAPERSTPLNAVGGAACSLRLSPAAQRNGADPNHVVLRPVPNRWPERFTRFATKSTQVCVFDYRMGQ